MSLALRFDEIRVNPSGTIEAFYTYGAAPLPAQASGRAISFASRPDAVAMKNNFVNALGENDFIGMALAIYAAAASDPNLTSATALAGKILTFDATKPNGALVYG